MRSALFYSGVGFLGAVMARMAGRREVLGLAAACAPVALVGAAAAQTSNAMPGDESHWRAIARQYDKPRGVIQLENGYWGTMARPVLNAYLAAQKRVNMDSSYYARRQFTADGDGVRARVAQFLGVSASEIVFTRGATEALQALIGNYHRLRPGDGVLLADLDYDSMQTAMRWLKARRGADVIEINLPEPATHESLIAAYAQALDRNPHVRLMLLTHLSHRTGLVLPVREIVALARARGVDVIVDSAHALGQLDFKLPDLGADFVGLNLHKWIGAPLGVGVMYVRQSRLDAIEPFMGESDANGPSIEARIHTGTTNFAAVLTVPAALDFHERVGGPAKEARLRYLRTRWAEALRTHDRLEILTPADSKRHAGITSFRVKGKTSFADNRALTERLLQEHGIFTVARAGVAAGACVRVAPGLVNSAMDVDALTAALKTLLKA
jgi:selenocysteine lyase/cysteine desulfurase